MKSVLKWTEGMQFEATADGNSVQMDAKVPLGKNQYMTPKELVATGLGGCTAMDVIALLKKHKQAYQNFEVDVDITMSTGGYPSVFTHTELTFKADGQVDPKILLEAVHLSQTKYCGVSAMILKACPIHYTVILNNEKIGEGSAQFES
jgi:putative redox protein